MSVVMTGHWRWMVGGKECRQTAGPGPRDLPGCEFTCFLFIIREGEEGGERECGP